jgi:hypothetical protein
MSFIKVNSTLQILCNHIELLSLCDQLCLYVSPDLVKTSCPRYVLLNTSMALIICVPFALCSKQTMLTHPVKVRSLARENSTMKFCIWYIYQSKTLGKFILCQACAKPIAVKALICDGGLMKPLSAKVAVELRHCPRFYYVCCLYRILGLSLSCALLLNWFC